MIVRVTPVIKYSVRKLCVKPYYGHPNGCPNFGKKKGCPPKAPLFRDVYDTDRQVFAIYNVFQFAKHVRRMYDKHPNWSQRQAECCLYWQNGARKKLKEKIKRFLEDHEGYTAVICPEALGVDITATMSDIGVKLEWPPKQYAYQIALAGIRR